MDPAPTTPFFLFGAGSRQKYIYRAGVLKTWPEERLVYRCSVHEERIFPSEYRVQIQCVDDTMVLIEENERGIYLKTEGPAHRISADAVSLPDFTYQRFRDQLRVLHLEILWNLHDGKPLANALTSRKPRLREAAMIAMVLKKTGNVHLIQEWIDGLTEPFDRVNGTEEPDNLGQALFLVSLIEREERHPLIDRALEAARRFEREGHIRGFTDGGEHPLYQTLWLKYGLKCLGLEDEYVLPAVEDDYRHLFWWDFPEAPDPARGEARLAGKIDAPWLSWAEAHFLRQTPPMDLCGNSFPLSWDEGGPHADVSALRIIDPELAEEHRVTPHAGHAAEMFLCLWQDEKKAAPKQAK